MNESRINKVPAISRNLRVAEVCGHHFCAGLLGLNAVVLDLGANDGRFSSNLAINWGCRCHAVEPHPTLLQRIPHHPGITTHHYAVGTCDEPMSLNLSTNMEANSILPMVDDRCSSITVPGIRLQSLLEKLHLDQVDLLKMDIEGAELMVFDSTSDATLGKIQQLSVEFHDFLRQRVALDRIAAISSRLRRLGFVRVKYSLTDHSDVMFVNKRLAGLSSRDIFYLRLNALSFVCYSALRRILHPNGKNIA